MMLAPPGWLACSTGWLNPARVPKVETPVSGSVRTVNPAVCFAVWSLPQPGHRLPVEVGPSGHGTLWSPSQSAAGRSQPTRKQVW